jgi:hypothetical protein
MSGSIVDSFASLICVELTMMSLLLMRPGVSALLMVQVYELCGRVSLRQRKEGDNQRVMIPLA